MGNAREEKKHYIELALVLNIIFKIRGDEYNPFDWVTDDKGGEWHKDCPTNPYGDNFQDIDGDMEAYNPNAWVDDYIEEFMPDIIESRTTLNPDDDYIPGLHLLHEYLYLSSPYDSDHIRTLTLLHYSKFMGIDFSDVLDLVAMHPSKPSTTGLSKLRSELQGLNKKVFSDVVADYIVMMKEAGMPSVNETHIIGTKDKGLTTLAEFWHIYGAMAHLISGEDCGTGSIKNIDAHQQALIRFREKISGDYNVLYPLLAYLYSQWANDKDWLEQTNRMTNVSREDDEKIVYDELGYAGLMFAKDELEVRNNEGTCRANINRGADWDEFNDSDMVDFSVFIQKKYYT
jgi:hypothetical protein